MKDKSAGLNVSIHAPREGCDSAASAIVTLQISFQFTHPGRGATISDKKIPNGETGFNSRTPGGVRRESIHVVLNSLSVSIHAPREGCDAPAEAAAVAPAVSIHAPREGCDHIFFSELSVTSEFQFTHTGRGATKFF